MDGEILEFLRRRFYGIIYMFISDKLNPLFILKKTFEDSHFCWTL